MESMQIPFLGGGRNIVRNGLCSSVQVLPNVLGKLTGGDPMLTINQVTLLVVLACRKIVFLESCL